MLEKRPKKIRLVEVGPRDGLQNEKTKLSTQDKVDFIVSLAHAGLKTIEATSFVRADKIPQMGDAKELFTKLKGLIDPTSINLPCLVPNEKGLEDALSVGVKEIAVFTATSEAFNKKNINATIEESFKRITPVIEKALKQKLKVRGYISTVFGCPYEGETSVEKLLKICERLKKLGVYEISLGDTIGIGNPVQVVKIIQKLKKDFDLKFFSMHFHDTRGTALANILTSLEEGITSFDASAGGLGGCPYARGSSGNVATEDVVYMLESMGVATGVNMKHLSAASRVILDKIGKETPSKYLKAYMAMEDFYENV